MDNGMKAGTAGGTILAFITNMNKDDILKTVVLTMIGSVVSFTVSLLLQWMINTLKKRRMSHK
jgi:mannitol-specific phosphotransferase system IIBC component